MPKPIWSFRRMTPGEINSDPVQEEFFANEVLDSLGEALVRESVQNSLDAGVPGERVRVRFGFSGSGYGEPSERMRYLDGLEPHLLAKGSGLKPPHLHPMNFLVVEDFGTRGLEGDPGQNDDQSDEAGRPKNDFYYFFRNVGITVHEEGERGRWGLGKTVFPASSGINSFFGVTRRKSDGKSLLMGQSILKTHKIDGRKHYPYGWFGLFQDDDFALPISEPNIIDHFSRQFGITRTCESGLSVVVPFPDMTITPQQIISASIRHYFFPILSGSLAVEVEFDGSNKVIDSGTIDQYISQIEKSKLKRWSEKALRNLFAFVRWGIGLRDDEYHWLNETGQETKPEWSDSLFNSETLDAIRNAFDAEQRLAFRVPMAIQKKGGAVARNTRFDVWIQRDSALDRAEDHFIREDITIPGVSSLKGKGVRAIVVAKDKVLSTFLGDAENPAHTEWQERSPKFKDRYVLGPSCLRFVKNSPREIFDILSKPGKKRENDLLMGIFSIAEKKSGPGKGTSPISPPLPPSAPKLFDIASIAGGFKISGKTGDGSTSLKYLYIKAAYEIRRGNPFARYSIYDFNVDEPPITTAMMGCKIHQARRNEMIIEIADPIFHCEVRGFDVNRDIRVEAKPVSTI